MKYYFKLTINALNNSLRHMVHMRNLRTATSGREKNPNKNTLIALTMANRNEKNLDTPYKRTGKTQTKSPYFIIFSGSYLAL